jgi:hypothetical protein
MSGPLAGIRIVDMTTMLSGPWAYPTGAHSATHPAKESAMILDKLRHAAESHLAVGRGGRILLHMLAMLGDRCVRFHLAGIGRELPSYRTASSLPSI